MKKREKWKYFRNVHNWFFNSSVVLAEFRQDSYLKILLDFCSDHCCIWLSGQTTNTSSGATAVNPLFRNAMYTIAFGGVEGPVRSE